MYNGINLHLLYLLHFICTTKCTYKIVQLCYRFTFVNAYADHVHLVYFFSNQMAYTLLPVIERK
jgi:hypothetical protein